MNHIAQLKTVIKATGWSQEQLAYKLGVSFATLNSWVNERSKPRQKALRNIEKLYLDTVGVDSVDKVAWINAKQRALALTISLETLANREVLDKLTLYMTYHTNTIEGSTMTLSDVRDVIFDQKVIANRSAIEQAEARNHQAALHWLVDQITGKDFVINEALILGVHLRLMNGIISDAGMYRKHSVRIMGSRVAVANWAKIPSLVSSLTAERSIPPRDPLGHLAQFHARFEQIHPFSDGNGRTGRLILFAQALQAGVFPPLIIEEQKYAYYKYLEKAQIQDDFSGLEMFIAQSIIYAQELLGLDNTQ